MVADDIHGKQINSSYTLVVEIRLVGVLGPRMAEKT